MKKSTLYFLLLSLSLTLFAQCQKDNSTPTDPVLSSSGMVPFFHLGDTLHTIGTETKQITITLDSTSITKLRLEYTGFDTDVASTRFVKPISVENSYFHFLDSIISPNTIQDGPILASFNEGDSIKINYQSSPLFLDWWDSVNGMDNTGWLRYHIYEVGGSFVESIPVGDNFIPLKFEIDDNPHLGWMKLFYTDEFIVVKEGYYSTIPNQDILVGNK